MTPPQTGSLAGCQYQRKKPLNSKTGPWKLLNLNSS